MAVFKGPEEADKYLLQAALTVLTVVERLGGLMERECLRSTLCWHPLEQGKLLASSFATQWPVCTCCLFL